MKKIGIIILILIILVAWGNTLNEVKETTSKKYNVLQENDILIQEIYESSYYFEGIAKNISNNNKEYVTIKITQYDKENNKLGYWTDTITDLKANETWKFKVMKYTDMAKYEIKISAY